MEKVLNSIRFLTENYINVMDYLEKHNVRKGLFIYVNPFNYFYFRNQPDLMKISKYRMDGFFVNTLVSRFCGLKGTGVRQSFDMTSLAPKIFDYCSRKELSIFFAGGKVGDVEKFIDKIRPLYPDLKIAGHCSGYLDGEDIIEKVKLSQANVVVLGLGNIKQESVGYQLFCQYEALVFTCGAFISQTANSEAGEGSYYPDWINKYNLRWLYRFVKEPHVIKRVAIYYPKFLLFFFKDLLFYKFEK